MRHLFGNEIIKSIFAPYMDTISGFQTLAIVIKRTLSHWQFLFILLSPGI